MDHKEKIERMIQEFTKRGISKFTLAPPIYRLLWRCGINIRPPLFSSFLFLFVFIILTMIIPSIFVFTLLFGLDYSLDYRSYKIIVFIGVFIALFESIFYRSLAKDMNLPLWKDYLKNESEVEAKGKVRKKGSGLREKKRFVLK